MQRVHAGKARVIGVDGDARNPDELVARKHQRPRVALFTRHQAIDENVLQLAGAPSNGGSNAKAGRAKPKPQVKASAEVSRMLVGAAVAYPDVKTRRGCGGVATGRRSSDLHQVAHDTKTQTPGQIHAAPSTASLDQAEHRVELGPRKARLSAAGAPVEHRKHLAGDRLGKS